MSYRRCHFVVMSGTGNSYRVAQWMATAAERAGVESQVRLLEEFDPTRDRLDSADELLVVVHPTHGFTAPWHLLKSLWRWPRTSAAHAACLTTRAGIPLGSLQPWGVAGSAPFLVAALLRRAGYRVRGLAALNMPSNWMSLHSGLNARSVERVRQRSRPQAEHFVEQLLSGRTAFVSASNLYEAVNGLLLAPVSLLYLLLGRIMLAKLFHANTRCNGCHLCADACPIGAIEMRDGRPFWLTHCESCMRCMGYCTKQSVEASHSFLLLVTLLNLVPVVLWFHFFGFSALTGHPLWDVPLVLLVLMLLPAYPLMLGAYRAFQWVLRFRWANRLFTRTTLTHYYRRYHEPETRLKMLRRHEP